MTLTQERTSLSSCAPDEALLQEWKKAVHDHSLVEPLEAEMPYLSQELGRKAAGISVLTAADNDAGSYKWRGAFNAAFLAKEQGASAITAASAANFGAGVALAGKNLGLQTDLYVPRCTSERTIAWLKKLGPSGSTRIHAQGANVDESVELATHHALSRSHTRLLHPFDSLATMDGQGTMVDDILRAAPNTDQITITTGGNGAGSGMARRLMELDRADVRLTLVQASGSDSLERSLLWNEVTEATSPNRLYRGARVRSVGQHCLEQTMCYPNLHLVTVSDEEVRGVASTYIDQNNDLLRRDLPMYEPTTLLSFAALQSLDHGEHTVVVGTGMNQSPVSLFDKSSSLGARGLVMAHGWYEQK